MATVTSPYIGLQSLAIAGYRSFGAEPQRFDRFSKVNILIGQNNSGKSNVLRFIDERLELSRQRRVLSANDEHKPGPAPFMVGFAFSASTDVNSVVQDVARRVRSQPDGRAIRLFTALFEAKLKASPGELIWSDMDAKSSPVLDEWIAASSSIPDSVLSELWAMLFATRGGDRPQWLSQIMERIAVSIPSFTSHLVPAFRRIGVQGSVSDGFGGEGLIDRLVKLERPAASQQGDKAKFTAIRDFVRAVTSNPAAEIEIPHERDTINVNLNGQFMAIESLGTGIQEVIILAAAATVLDQKVVCIEEPELHLNPLLQKKLMRYLQEHTTNQYFITTHSAALMDTPDAEIYHLALQDGATKVTRVSSDKDRSRICADLGYHPSDLLQSNCVIWVEGPSDRIYLEWWISSLDAKLIEGIHYSIMFYGGRLASHLSADDDAADDFIKLRRLNRNGVIVMDSDKSSASAALNATKQRLISEFNQGPGHAFVTEGREIENYIEPELLRAAIARAHPDLMAEAKLGKFSNTLKLRNSRRKEAKANKVRIAEEVRATGAPDLDRFDLGDQVRRLVRFVRDSNPPIEV